MIGVYVHWPFCVSKCPYCDFNSRVMQNEDEEEWSKAYCQEIAYYADKVPWESVGSIYFGGGTPSLMKPSTLETILRAITNAWPLSEECEITIEANPTTVESEKFQAFRGLGLQRVSLGVQSFHDDALRFLGRAHDVQTAIHALDLALKIFPRVSFDLIYAYEGQTLASWRNDLQRAASYGAKHLSLYQLTIEPHTPFAIKQKQGMRLIVDEDHALALYALTQEELNKAGLPAYEVSNHASQGQESRHNLNYWRYGAYVGIGAGAHGRLPLAQTGIETRSLPWAIENENEPRVWKEQVTARGHGAKTRQALRLDEAQNEALLMGFRLTEGIDKSRWTTLFGSEISPVFSSQRWAKCIEEGWAKETETQWFLTPSGRERLNALLTYLV